MYPICLGWHIFIFTRVDISKEYKINNVELLLLKVLLNKDNWNKYHEEIDYDYLKTNFRELYFLYVTLRSLHEKHESNLTVDELYAAFTVQYPEADKVIYGNLFKRLSEAEIGDSVGQGILAEQKARKGALKLAEQAFRRAQGQITDLDLSRFSESIFEVDHQAGELPIREVNLDLEELIESAYAEEGYRWRLDCLNKSLGSLRPGDFGFIFARPETGKTTFLASEATSFISVPDSRIIWFNNEEQGNKVGIRLLQAYFGVTLDQLMAAPRKFKEIYQEQVGKRLHLFDAATIDRKDVEAIVKELNPGLVIYDQITKIKGFKADRQDLMLGDICQWARELAKGSHAAIGVSQADGSAEGVRYLTMEHVANAKTAMQAEADFILGIGKTHEQDAEYVRYLNISKNKLFGDKDSRPELRHGRFEVIIEPTIARYKDVIKFD